LSAQSSTLGDIVQLQLDLDEGGTEHARASAVASVGGFEGRPCWTWRAAV